MEFMAALFPCVTVPVDGSKIAQRGVRFAIELARDGGTLTLCSVKAAASSPFEIRRQLCVPGPGVGLEISRSH